MTTSDATLWTTTIDTPIGEIELRVTGSSVPTEGETVGWSLDRVWPFIRPD